MKYKVSITREVEAEDETLAALEGYSQIMRAGTDVETITLTVVDEAGTAKDITVSIEDADEHAKFDMLGGFTA